MSDAFRVMLLNASRGDRAARTEAIATQAVWFDQLPQSVRNNARFMVAAGVCRVMRWRNRREDEKTSVRVPLSR